MKRYSVAIDGPSGAGKSTLAKLLADSLGLIYVDTGAMYRAIGLFVLRMGIDSKDVNRILAVLQEIKIDIRHLNGVQHIILQGEDVSAAIRTEDASRYASDVSAICEVRVFLLELQREFAKNHSVIMDGRDIGTVILPDAEVKIFLTASPEERARRRFKEQVARGENVTFPQVFESILKRDQNDSTRKNAPLKAADDAILVDSTDMSLEETFLIIKKIVEERIN